MKRLLLSLALALPLCSDAQMHHEIGLMAGVSNYYGDLQNNFLPDYGYKPMGGIVYKYFMSPHIGIRFGASFATVTAADSLSNVKANLARNLSFESRIIELHGAFELNLLPIEVDRMKVTPYVFGGMSVFYFNPYALNPEGNKTYLRPLATEGQGLYYYPDRKEYGNVNIAFPFGGGMKFFIGKTLMLTTEIGFRYTNTDYIDDVSKSYVNLDTLASNKGLLAKQMSFRGYQSMNWDHTTPQYGYKRGDSKENDWYWFGGITITVYFRAFSNLKDYIQTRCSKFYLHTR